MDNGFSLADIGTMLGNRESGGCFGGGAGGIVLIILFAMIFLFGGGGLFGGNRGGNPNGQPVTEAALCNAMNFNDLASQVGRISDTQQTQFMQLNNGLCQIGYETLGNFNALERQLASCCCDVQRGIDSVNYNGAMNTAAINANTTAQTQKILDAICGNRMADMQNQISQLQLQSALSGVVRYPSTFAYNAGVNPFCGGCGCGC